MTTPTPLEVDYTDYNALEAASQHDPLLADALYRSQDAQECEAWHRWLLAHPDAGSVPQLLYVFASYEEFGRDAAELQHANLHDNASFDYDAFGREQAHDYTVLELPVTNGLAFFQ